MTLFRGRKKGDVTCKEKLENPSGRSVQEKVLQGQVYSLQKEMKLLNERLTAMQTNVRNTGTASPASTVNSTIPSTSMRSASNERTQLSSDQYLRNKSLRKKKGMEDIFVPCEIDFLSNVKKLHSGKATTQTEMRVSNIFKDEPPVREIETRKTLSSDTPYSSRKTKTVYQPPSQVFGDAESTSSSQRSAFTMQNGRKVRRIVRKVRGLPPPNCNSKMHSRSRVPRSREKRESSEVNISMPPNLHSETSQITSHPKNALLEGTTTGLELNKVGKNTKEPPITVTESPDSSLLEGIRAGVKLRQVERAVKEPQRTTQSPQSSPLLEAIKAGVELKQIDRTMERPHISTQDPKSSLLEGIKAGVKLKQVDRSSLQTKKKQSTPMSELLANIQKRKQAYLRQEKSCEEIGIDW